MAKHALSKKTAREIQIEAGNIARSHQLPRQTKEQTKLIAQGIQKGIEQYRKQQSAKQRDFDKELKKLKQQAAQPQQPDARVEEKVVYRQHWSPWVLLVMTWIGVALFYFWGTYP